MDPNLIGPVMSSYFADRTRHPHGQAHRALGRSTSRVPAPSLASRLRQASGAVLIVFGRWLTGPPEAARSDPAESPTAPTS